MTFDAAEQLILPLPTRADRSSSLPRDPVETCSAASWISVAKGAPYFVDDAGAAWTPVGQNDSVAWVDLAGLFRRRDLAGVEAYLRMLAAHGVTVLRVMLECAHSRHRYLERPAGRFVPAMVQVWDDLFALCARHNLRLLLTPYDTFWMWVRWRHHPLNIKQGGVCASPRRFLLCAGTRAAIKNRMTFAVERWGNSGVVFAWDLWNEIHPAHAGDRPDCVEIMDEFIGDLSDHVRKLECRLHGRAHPQTVSLFGPELNKRPRLAEPVFRHPSLDFATTHLYAHGTIDDPRDTIAAAIDVGRLVRDALAEIRDDRPYFDSEHGPIHAFKDKHRILPEAFDDEYFRHIQWAHVASGGAGGGMRWANRHPHRLTAGMRDAQKSLAGFLPLIDWTRFRRRNLNEEVRVTGGDFASFACGDAEQAIVWLLRTDALKSDGTIDREKANCAPRVHVPGLRAGSYRVTEWDTSAGAARGSSGVEHDGKGAMAFEANAIRADSAFAVRRSSS